MKSDLRTQSLDLLRFPLAVIVVSVHIFNKEAISISGMTFDVCQYSLYNDFLLFVAGFLRGISVPVYFFISGYVFFLGVNHFTKDVYFKKLKNRVFTLLIPFVIWNMPEMIIQFGKYIFYDLIPFSTYGVELNLTLKNILSCFWKYNGELFVPITPSGDRIIGVSPFPLNAPLWFIRDLIVVVIFTPIIHYIIKHTKYFVIVVLLGLSFIPNIQIPHLGAFLFFFMGAFLSIYNKDMVVEFGRYFKMSMIIYPLFSLLTIIAIKQDCSILYHIFKQISVLGFLIFAYNISIWLLKNTRIRPGKILPPASFFIYVSHILIFMRVTKLIFMFMKPDNGVEIISSYLLSVILTVSSLLAVFVFMKKYTPGILHFVTGRK